MQRLIDFISQDPPGFHLRWVFFLLIENLRIVRRFRKALAIHRNKTHSTIVGATDRKHLEIRRMGWITKV